MTPQEKLSSYVAPAGLLSGKVVLITGASRGIGRAVSAAVAAKGGQCVLMARNVQQLDAFASECVAQGLHEPGIVPVNLEGAGVADHLEFAELVCARYGRLDGIVLNAGMLGEIAPLGSYDPVSWARVFQLNVHSQFMLLQAMLPLVGAGDGGSIIFTSSGVGRKGRAYWGAYAASKFAVEGMMQTLADEYEGIEPVVRVNSLNPGRLRTEMRAQAYPAEDPTTLLEPAAIADAYLFLLGADSVGVNGCALDAQNL